MFLFRCTSTDFAAMIYILLIPLIFRSEGADKHVHPTRRLSAEKDLLVCHPYISLQFSIHKNSSETE